MEEKERYEWNSPYDSAVRDNKNDDIINAIERLNEQDKRIKELEEELAKQKEKYDKLYGCYKKTSNEDLYDKYRLAEENHQLKQQVEELKGKRLEFYNDDVRQTQVINGVHFDIEHLLVFSEYVEHEKNISADKDKQINQLKQQLHDLPKKIVEEIRDDMSKRIIEKQIKWGDNIQIGFICNAINECLDTILKKYGDKNESNND